MANKAVNLKYYINYIVIAIVAVAFGAVSLAGALPSSTIYLLEKIAIAIMLAVSLSMVVGFLGELSLGHAGFMCVGAYLGGKVSALLEASLGKGLPNLIISVIVGGAVAALFGIIVGLPALRLKGDYLAIVTLAFGEIVRSVFMNTSDESFGGADGLETPRFQKKELFIIAFVLVIVCLFVVQNLIRSKHGRAITAIRDNEIAAKATGINVTQYKLAVFTISSLFAGIAGVLYSFSNFTVQPAKFSYNYSIEILVMVVLGGMGSINGSIIAATLIPIINFKLQEKLPGDLAALKFLIYALILIGIVIFNNAPALKGIKEKLSIKGLVSRLVAKNRKPGDILNDEAQWDKIPTKISMDEVLSTDIQQGNEYTPDKPVKGGN